MYQKERWGIFLTGVATIFLMGGSFFVYGYVKRSVEERRSRELAATLDQVIDGTTDKVDFAVDLLYDLRGLVSNAVDTPTSWENFLRMNELDLRFPGIYSTFYAPRVYETDLNLFEERLRSQGRLDYQNYVVYPRSNKSEYLPVKFLHTAEVGLDILLGLDLKSFDRHGAFNMALETDGPVISKLVDLNELAPSLNKNGYLIVLPVYSSPSIKDYSLEERTNFLTGFVGTWISSSNLRDEVVALKDLQYSLIDQGLVVLKVGSVNEVRSTVHKEVQILNRKFNLVLESGTTFQLTGVENFLPEITLIMLGTINLLWWIVVYSALSARKRALDRALLATKDLRKFKQAVDGVSDQVVITDPEGVIIYANKAATEITGYSVEEMIGKKPSLWGRQMPKEYYEKFWKTIKCDKKSYWGELTNRRKSGELYEVEIRVSPILDEQGSLLFFVSIERDVSRIKSVDRMKTEFISLASHQLRTPLSAVKWFGELLMGGDAGKLTKTQEKYLSKIYESNEREIQLVNALLNVSRIESGKIVVSPKLTNLKEMVEGVLGEMKVNIAGENKILQYTIDKNVPKVMIDAELIKHVYSNLLSNALKYTNDGGKITVKVYLKGNKVITEVKDNGIGIPKGEQKRIAEKFFRGSNALKKETEGNGLGLYLAKTIVESSGGRIWFESAEGKGSAFMFSLPVRSIRRKK